MIDMKMNPVNSEVEKWNNKKKDEKKEFDFIDVDFLVDMREAENRYKKEYREDVGGIRTLQFSFNQWLDYKKFEAAKFHVQNSEFNLD